MFMRPHWLGRARCPPARPRSAVAARRAVYCIPRPVRAPPAPPGARASSPGHTPGHRGHARAWRWIWFWSMEREREDRASACSGPCGMVFTSPCNANGLGHTDTPYTPLFRSRARRSTVAHAGEPSTYASSFNRTEPRRGAMARAKCQPPGSQGLRQQALHRPPA